MMVVMLTLFWGGFAGLLWLALRRDREEDSSDPKRD